jgi:anti-sigma B factor antagonist
LTIQRRLVESVEITENSIHIIRLRDIFDASTVNEFEKVVTYLLARNFYKVVVDLGHVEFISSAGWGAFTAELSRVRQNQGDLKLANMSPDVYDVFLLLELDSFVQSFDTVEEAVSVFLRPVETPAPDAVRPSILQEIKAAARFRELAEARAAAAAEPPTSGFSENLSREAVAQQEAYASGVAARPSEKDGAPERANERFDPPLDRVAPADTAKDVIGAQKREFESAEGSTVSEGKDETASTPDLAGGQFEYAFGNAAAEAEFKDSSAEAYGEYGAAEQETYAGENDVAEFDQEGSFDEPYGEYGAADQTAYTGDSETGGFGYSSSIAAPYDENSAAEQEAYDGESEAAESGYEGAAAEFFDEYGAEEYAGDGETTEDGGEGSGVESDNEYGAEEYAGDSEAAEDGGEDFAAESDDDYDAVEQEAYAGDSAAAEFGDEGFAGETYGRAVQENTGKFEGEVFSAETYDEEGAAGELEYTVAGDNGAAEDEGAAPESYNAYAENAPEEYAGDNEGDEFEYEALSSDGAAEAAGDDAVSGEAAESASAYLNPPAANGPEMWELLLAGGDFSGAAPGLDFDGHAAKANAGSPREDFTAPISGAGLDFSGHEPIVEDNRQAGAVAESAADEEKKYASAFEVAGDEQSANDRFEEFETQDIRDPWILDEIDTLPEEYEMEDGVEDEGESALAGPELLAYDLEVEEPPLFAEHAHQQKARPDGVDAPVAPVLNGAADSEMDLLDSPAPEEQEENQDAPEFASPDEAPEAEMPALASPDEDLSVPEGEASETEEKSLPSAAARKKKAASRKSKTKKKARSKSSRSKAKSEAPSRLSEVEEPPEPPAESEIQYEAGSADADGDIEASFSQDEDEAAAGAPNFAAPEHETAMPALAEPLDDEDTPDEAESAASRSRYAAALQALPELLDEDVVPGESAPALVEKNYSEEDFAEPAADDQLSEEAPAFSHYGNGEADHSGPADDGLRKIPASGNVDEIIRAVVVTHPDFGPAMICKFIENRFEPPPAVSPSTVYRFLRDANLNTREKRQEYADQLFDPSELAEEI